MHFRISLLAVVLTVIRSSRAAAKSPSPARIAADLAPLLSSNADVVVPDDTQAWHTLISRPSWPRINPGYLAVVEVSNEEDIQHAVRYANSKNLPFLAVSTGHAWTSKANALHNGIQISMRKMQSVTVNRGGKTATIVGGTTQNTALKTPAEFGKRAVIGPLLGGGHSMLQGQHGFAADNLVSARLVLGNGVAITVSDHEHPDLFWAIRGAGHNFGIVSSFEVKIHDVPQGEAGLWTLTILNFDPATLETFFATWNHLEDTYPNTHGLLILNGQFANDPTNHTPIISLSIVHEGHNPIAEIYISEFRSLGPLWQSLV